jgi:hypothetical protein
MSKLYTCEHCGDTGIALVFSKYIANGYITECQCLCDECWERYMRKQKIEEAHVVPNKS